MYKKHSRLQTEIDDEIKMEKETNKKTTTIRDSIIPITSTQSPIIIKIVVFNPIQGIKTIIDFLQIVHLECNSLFFFISNLEYCELS
jgi:hypothetical protein